MSDLETLFLFFVYSWAIIKLNDMLNDLGKTYKAFQRRIRNEAKAEFHKE